MAWLSGMGLAALTWLWIGGLLLTVGTQARDRSGCAATYSAGAAVLLWISLAALLLMGSSKSVIPGTVGAIAWIAIPLSGLSALASIGVLYDPQSHWPVILPAVVPVLIAGYVFYALFPPLQTISTPSSGLAILAA